MAKASGLGTSVEGSVAPVFASDLYRRMA